MGKATCCIPPLPIHCYFTGMEAASRMRISAHNGEVRAGRERQDSELEGILL